MRLLGMLTISLALSLTGVTVTEANEKPLSVIDVMKFSDFGQRELSENGHWLAYTSAPDYGDGEAVLIPLDGAPASAKRHVIPRANHVSLTADGRWAMFIQDVSLLTREQTEKKERKNLHKKAILLNTESGEQKVFDDVNSAEFTGDDRALVITYVADDETKLHRIEIRQLATDKAESFARVRQLEVAKEGPRLVIAQAPEAATDAEENEKAKNGEQDDAARVIVYNSSNGGQLLLLDVMQKVADMQFSENGERVALLYQPNEATAASDEAAPYFEVSLWRYGQNEPTKIVPELKPGLALTEHSTFTWSKDGQRLFFGLQEIAEDTAGETATPDSIDALYDLDRLTADRGLQVWHGQDARIKPHEKETYGDRRKETYIGVYHLADSRYVSLANERVESLQLSGTDKNHSVAVLGYDRTPYLRSMSWDGFYHDLYHIDLATGTQQLIANKVNRGSAAELSPDGRYVAWFQNGQMWLYDAEEELRRAVATDVIVSWADEDHDTPDLPSGYGIAGWLDDSSSFLAYDKFDVWQINVAGQATNLTQAGRQQERQYRVVKTDPDQAYIASNKPMLLRGFSQADKNMGLYRLTLAGQLNDLVETATHQHHFISKAKDADRYLLTRENFREFPDLWVADSKFEQPEKVTELNPQIAEFKWGSSELIKWRSVRGDELEGVVIKPDNFDPEKRYPVLVYYYEKFAQRLHEFNPMKVNHRPNFPLYVSNDYVVFLPDVHFNQGEPGRSATDSLVPGIQKLIDMGIADKDAIGLHGHSWSGYQTAHVITQTDAFAAAVAGAPVVNMTSAYNGIRWGTGLARQFQYEQGQSRIGESMAENLPLYIENSPVFFADRINTPLLMQFGDEDGAVPWEQGIEMYLEMRRLDKPVVMLQYEGEPHHLQKYPNKVDYTIKMKAFFDHYLKGAEAPTWWTKGQAYEEPAAAD